jgi:hypothetical protein
MHALALRTLLARSVFGNADHGCNHHHPTRICTSPTTTTARPPPLTLAFARGSLWLVPSQCDSDGLADAECPRTSSPTRRRASPQQPSAGEGSAAIATPSQQRAGLAGGWGRVAGGEARGTAEPRVGAEGVRQQPQSSEP